VIRHDRSPTGTGGTGRAPDTARARNRAAISAVVGIAVAVALGGWTGPAVGLVVGAGAYQLLARQPSAAARAERARVAADLPFAADLLAAALRAGAAPDVAARCVGSAIGGPLGDRLSRVDRALRLGAPADEAWAYLGDGPAPERIVRAAIRSQHSGSAFAGALSRVADDIRADQVIAAEAAARRAAILIVLPLGLCFLPAFVLAGLVPFIGAVLGDVLSR
jgi:Flp pilus assembly protein TadB